MELLVVAVMHKRLLLLEEGGRSTRAEEETAKVAVVMDAHMAEVGMVMVVVEMNKCMEAVALAMELAVIYIHMEEVAMVMVVVGMCSNMDYWVVEAMEVTANDVQ